MKLYKHTPINILRVSIRKQGYKTEHLSIVEATNSECMDFLKELLKNEIDPFATGKKTSIDIREAVGGKNKSSISFSFYGLDPAHVKSIIERNLTA